MPEPEPEPATERKRLILDLPGESWEDLVREAAEVSIAEGNVVTISEIARRRIVAGNKVSA